MIVRMKSGKLFGFEGVHIGYLEVDSPKPEWGDESRPPMQWGAGPVFFTRAEGREIIRQFVPLWGGSQADVADLLVALDGVSEIPADTRAFVEALDCAERFGPPAEVRLSAGRWIIRRVRSRTLGPVRDLHEAFTLLDDATRGIETDEDESAGFGLDERHALTVFRDLVTAGCTPASIDHLRTVYFPED